jgi:hypothetical protein
MLWAEFDKDVFIHKFIVFKYRLEVNGLQCIATFLQHPHRCLVGTEHRSTKPYYIRIGEDTFCHF